LMSKTKQRTTSKGVAGKPSSSKHENRPSSKGPRMADEPEPKTDMLTNMVNMMKMNGLDTDSPAVKEQI
jgi:hypothetical protein